MLVSIIIPVYNQLPLVLKLINSIASNRSPNMMEVILIDDASTDFDLKEHVGHPFTVIRNEVNRGFVASENIGAQQASGDLLLFLNSDIQVRPGWLDPMIYLISENKSIGVIGPKLVFPLQTWCYTGRHYGNPSEQTCPDHHCAYRPVETIQSAGGLYDAALSPFHRFLGWRASDPHVNKVEKVSWVTGAALLTQRSLFDRLGGFDEAYGKGYYDDPDYCERVRQAGYEIWYQPQSVMTHSVGVSMSATQKTDADKIKAARAFRNNATRFHSKWNSALKPDVNFISGAM